MLGGVLKSPDSTKVSAGRFALVTAVIMLIVVYAFVGWRIGFEAQTWQQWQGFVDSFRDGMAWLGLGGYGINKGRATVVDAKKASRGEEIAVS